MNINGQSVRVAWVLGAGFSRSLGGPLLVDLFRQRELDDLKIAFPEGDYSDLALHCWAVQRVYNFGKLSEHSWEDAEIFLAATDQGPAHGTWLDGLCRRALGGGSDGVKALAGPLLKRAVRRALAAECEIFTRQDQKAETWGPYRNWVAALDKNDTLLSFNYDRVVEIVLGTQNSTMLPGTTRPADVPVLLKLHGSVDWLIDQDMKCRRVEVQEALKEPSDLIAIASPGSTKMSYSRGPFAALWAEAEAALQKAQAVIFLGYGFPKSDAESLRRLLGAIRLGQSPHLRIDLVLGDDAARPAALRVKALLETCILDRHKARADEDFMHNERSFGNRRTARLRQPPFFVEDYLATVEQQLGWEYWHEPPAPAAPPPPEQ